MNDKMLVTRYSEYLTKIMFNHADPWLKGKYSKFRGGEIISLKK